MYEFLGNDHIIQSHSSRNKGDLEGRYKLRQQRKKSLNYDLSDHFVHYIAQAYQSKGCLAISPWVLWDESNKDLV